MKIPNLGYTLSNKKLLKTGFKFLQFEESINEMIAKWSKTNTNKRFRVCKDGEK